MLEQQRGKLWLVVAAAGYGKTTALRRLFPGPAVRWRRECDVDALLGGELVELAAGPAQVVLDGLPAMSERTEQALLRAIASLPDDVRLALSSRWPVGCAASSWLTRMAPAQLRPAELSLTNDQVDDLLHTEYGLTVPALAQRVHEVTAGWPALVRLVAETLVAEGVPSGPLLPAVTEPGGLVTGYVAEEVLGPLPEDLRRLLHEVADLAPLTAGVCAVTGHPAVGPQISRLVRTGLLTRVGTDPDTGPRVVPVIAAVAGHNRPPVAKRTLLRAATWYREHGPARAAAYTFRLGGDDAELAAVLDEHGDRMIVAGRPGATAELVAALPAPLRTRRLRLLAGDALRTAGDVTAAARAYQEVAAAEPAWEPGIAWRMGLIHYLRGDQPRALADFARGDEVPGCPTDQAMLLAWTAAATARSGDAAAGLEHAWRAYRLAAETGGDSALATAHVSLALCLGLTGDQVGGEEHHRLALGIAERTGDLVLLARILVNQSYHLVEQARYPAALAAAQQAAGHAEAAGHANLYAMAAGTEADMLAMLGRYDEAAARYAQVLARHQRMGSRRCADTYLGLAELHLMRGWREQARAAFAEAVRLADGSDSRKLTVRAHAGLARVLLPDDTAAAARHAAEAARLASDDLRVPALLAQGWVTLAGGDAKRTARLADEALDLARSGGLRAGLARALELRAAAEIDPNRARAALREAHAIWVDASAVGDAARAALALSRLPGATADDRFAALLAAERLTAGGVSIDQEETQPDRPAAGRRPTGVGVGGVLVRTLGRFEVRVAGAAVPPSAWQSRRARDLLRILVVRRGRPVPRGELCELLWPDDDPSRTGHRLSVLLSIVRGVLDPDRVFASDHYLVTDAASVALDVTHLRVDVMEFLGAVTHGRELLDRGARAEARTILTAAVRDYRADVFSDEPYADWASALREQARAAYVAALRMLAEAHRSAGDAGAAVDCLLRLLEQDPYDEPAHRMLVRTLVTGGQHGEARRAFARYRTAMRAIGVRPPDEIILAPRAGVRPPATVVRRPG
ncbi:BTAD domain-containing putative transcriptional regulator [Micromonospora sp. NPDC049891]|uniref:BTAD domain-containing putative transcriptional regulator n=1 Tax=Micromonospora sp. NPDC049891 TaxID=3155655 RepID=UPI0033CB0CE2